MSNSINTALVTVQVEPRYMRMLEEALAPAEVIEASRDDKKAIADALSRADVAIIDPPITDQFLNAPHLRWVHCDASGIESSAWPEFIERGVIITGSAGRAAPVLAEHVFFLALALTYDAPGMQAAQLEHRWRGIPGYLDRRGIYGKTIGLVGYGFTSKAVAERAKAFGMRVLAYRRAASEPDPLVDRFYSSDNGDALDDLLKESDIVVLAVRLSDETFHMIGRDQLRLMKPTAYLINMARGAIVDEAALVEALHEGTIAGAGSDVFEKEPLPPDSPLWSAPNMIITPHWTPDMPDVWAGSAAIVVENIRRFREGKPLVNRLEPRDAYTKARK